MKKVAKCLLKGNLLKVYKYIYIYIAKPLKVDIADKIKNEETYSEADAINLMLQMAKGCEYLHMNDLNHKGLNTMKVLVTPSKQIKICDFGLATIVDAEGFRLGAAPAPIYTAPEIFFGEKYTYEPDIWSMGAIFYEILTLKQAFNRPYTQEIIIAIRNQTYDKELLRKHSNDKLFDLITKMLIKKEHRISLHQIISIIYIYIYITIRNIGWRARDSR